MAKNGTVAYIGTPKACDICKFMGTPDERETPARAKYDFVTKTGHWAFGCEEHYLSHRKYNELGLGKGQELKLYSAGI